ncbi:MAG: sigma-54 dependent transcriptional regulator [Candidatus Krumholzibacteria bacterium]|jgi:DNA-binding NtrC family response regulator|nr:sigma-54 dependent transcriptional regulator [Candidatus Krumholzibacteria bacterium]
MDRVPSGLEERYRRFLDGRGDDTVALVLSLREKGLERPGEGAWTALVLSRIYHTKGRPSLAASYLRLAAELFRRSPEGRVPAGLHVNRAVIMKAEGRRREAAALLEKTFRVSLERGETLAAAKAAVNLAVIRAEEGRFDEAASFSEFARRTYIGLGMGNGAVSAGLARAFIENLRGNHDEAVEIVHQLGSRPAGGPGDADRRQRLTGLLICAEAHLRMSHTGHASAVLDEIASCRDALELFRPVRIRWVHLMSRLERSRGRGSAAEALSRTALAMAQRCGLECAALQERDPRLAAAPGPRPATPGRHDRRAGAANEDNPASPGDGCPFVTGDPGMISILERIREAAPFPVPVLLTGESGVGKEVVAGLIHRWSGRGALPFIPVNAAALPPGLFESALFGHAKGAFTGAGRERRGLLETAGDGTIFLDEIGELPPGLQAKLLRFLDSGEYYPVGGDTTKKSGARVIAATNRDLESAVESGGFRGDLFHRLSALSFRIPPLRERPGDIRCLCSHFLRSTGEQYGIGPLAAGEAALRLLESHSWPGNARELRNVLLAAAIKRGKGRIAVSDMPPGMLRRALESGSGKDDDPGPHSPGGFIYEARTGPSRKTALRERLRAIEKEQISLALSEASGNMTRAASILGLKRTTLLYRMKRCGLDPRGGGIAR